MSNHALGRVASLLMVVFAGSTSGCGNASASRSGTGTFTLANDTTSTVSVRDCGPGITSCDSAAPTTLAPAKAETLPMSSLVIGSVPDMLFITGFGSGPRCFIVPPNDLPEPLRLAVTDATPAQCDGRATVLAPSLSSPSSPNQASSG